MIFPLRRFRLSLFCVVAGVAMVSLPGCSGCLPNTAQNNQNQQAEDKEKEKEKKDKEKPKPDFEFKDDEKKGLVVLPGDPTNGVKPGHWMSISQPVKANNYDFHGELTSAAVDNNRRALQLPKTAYRLEMARPAALPKSQLKHLEMNVFLPHRADGPNRSGTRASLLARLNSRGGGRTVKEFTEPTSTMEPYRYYLLVLAKRPDAYNYVKVTDAIRPPKTANDVLGLGGNYLHYSVVAPKLDKHVPVPSNPLMWTTIAYVIWDDIDPDLLTLDQQDALVDWLHWGGQLIISGPNSLETLKNSFLARHLPAAPGATVKLPQEKWRELNRFSFDQPTRLEVIEEKPPEGVVLQLRSGGSFVSGTGELLAHKRLGLGHITVTSFALTNPQVVNWKSFDGFFNACILRRPPREFYTDREGWTAGARFTGLPRSIDKEKDARLTTKVRYFSRDSGKADDWQSFNWTTDAPLFDRGFREGSGQSGMAGWNDYSGASDCARDALNDAADISVPERTFVLRALAVYLVVLVPVNWGLFWLIGRVEWAWAAAPVIAVCGALAVVHYAQLDIGFARSRTEVAVLELQGDHPRGHLTRYMELYTSLSTRYNAEFVQASALAQPMGDPKFHTRPQPTISTVTFARDSDVTLRGFKVESSTTRMLHTEEMYSIGGGISLEQQDRGWVVVNDSDLAVQDVGVIRRLPTEEGRGKDAIRVAWIGQLQPKSKVTLNFQPVEHDRALLPQWEQSSITKIEKPEDDVSLVRLLDLARDPRRLLPGDVKLIGWTEEELPGVTLRPRPSNRTTRTLVVANLKYAPSAAPARDVNTLAAIKAKLKNGETFEFEGGSSN